MKTWNLNSCELSGVLGVCELLGCQSIIETRIKIFLRTDFHNSS